MIVLTIQSFAETRARMEAGGERVEILAALGLDEDGWASEEERILAELADAAESAELAPLRAYSAAYDAEWRSLVGTVPGSPATTATVDAQVTTEATTSRAETRSAKPIGSETTAVDFDAMVRASVPFPLKPAGTMTPIGKLDLPVPSDPTPPATSVAEPPKAQGNARPIGSETTAVDFDAMVRASLPFPLKPTPTSAGGVPAIEPGTSEPSASSRAPGTPAAKPIGSETAAVNFEAMVRASVPFARDASADCEHRPTHRGHREHTRADA